MRLPNFMTTHFHATAVPMPPGSGSGVPPVLATDAIFEVPVGHRPRPARCVIGVLEGEGIGAEVTAAALRVLRAVDARSSAEFAVETGGVIGLPAVEASGCCLPPDVRDFCQSIFDRGGAVLAGAGGGRFVYDVRRHFDLFVKLNPVWWWPELDDVCAVKSDVVRGVNLVVVRENLGGLYQGQTREVANVPGQRVLEHSFHHRETEIRRFLTAAARLARHRRGGLAVVHKSGGLPDLAALWRAAAMEIADIEQVDHRFLDIDFASYLLLQEPRQFDVIAAPNCFADILSDLGGVHMGGRGLTFGASFGADGAAVYQTNHGAAYDLQGTDRGNPIGHMLALAMMLRESFGLVAEALLIEGALRRVVGAGIRTDDVAGAQSTRVGTMELADHVAAELAAA